MFSFTTFHFIEILENGSYVRRRIAINFIHDWTVTIGITPVVC